MKPVLQALVLAEHVYEEKSGKKIIAGTLNALQIKRTSDEEANSLAEKKQLRGEKPGSPYAYISLTDVCDGTEIQLQFVSLSKNHVVFGTTLQIHGKDRLATTEVIAALPVLPVNEPGVYAFEVVCEGEILGSLRIVAKEAP